GLCGHVLAWGEKSKTAYIAPMEVLFEDIKRTLGAEGVVLPVPEGRDPKKSALAAKEDSGIGMGSLGEDVAAQLKEMRLDENRRSGGAGAGASGAAGNGAVSSASGAPGGGGKTKGVVGVRQLVM